MTVPAHGPASPVPGPPRPGAPSRPATHDALAGLRAAVAALPPAAPPQVSGSGDTRDTDFDAADHAARFEAVHDALVAVLADVDGT